MRQEVRSAVPISASPSGEPTRNTPDGSEIPGTRCAANRELPDNFHGMWWRFGEDRKSQQHPHPETSAARDLPSDSHVGWLTWRTDNGDIQVAISEGTGQKDSPFCVRYQEFRNKCNSFGFTTEILGLFRPYSALAEFHYPPLGLGRPTHMEVIIANYENDAFTAFLRRDLSKMATRCILFVKTADYERRLSSNDAYQWLNQHKQALGQYPLQLISSILAMVQSRSRKQERLRRDINDLEARLGVTAEQQGLLRRGYSEESVEFVELNADMVTQAKVIADCRVSATTIINHTCAVRRAMGPCRQSKRVRREELRAVNTDLISVETRAEMDLKMVIMAETMVQTLLAALYHRVSKRDSESMKTIAVVTTVFLPIIVVSAVFNSGIFDFFAAYPLEEHPAISSSWIIYLLVCVGLGVITFILWFSMYWRKTRKRSRKQKMLGALV